jgi:YD repeat-containing protein
VYPLAGVKRQSEGLGLSLGGASWRMTYDSALAPWTSGGQTLLTGEFAAPGDLGSLWWGSWHRQVYASGNGQSLKVARGDGRTVDFVLTGGLWSSAVDNRSAAVEQRDTLVALSGGGWRYTDQSGMGQEVYNSAGQMTSWVQASGMKLTPAFTSGNLTQLSDPFGRSVGVSYKSLTVGSASLTVLDTLTDPTGNAIVAGYDTNANLKTLTWQDKKVKTWVYDSANANQTWALTGVLDENAKRFATYGYDAMGRAISTEHAGGVDKYSVSWANGAEPRVVTSEVYDQTAGVIRRYRDWSVPQPPVVTWPSGALETFKAPDMSLNYPRDTGRTQPAGSGCAASSNAITYDANGNKASEDDFNGHRTCFAYSTGSATSVANLEKVRVEGLAKTVACDSVTAAGVDLKKVSGGEGARKITTAWHPQWALKTAQAEPLRLTTWVYNGQSDPFNGGAIANCASVTPNYGTSTTASLPDGSPIAVLCKKVEQATTDATGALGLSAALDTSAGGAVQRTWRYTYNQYGQVLTSTDPLSHTATYAYYPTTSFTGSVPNEVGHTQGDLQSVSNAAGHLTTYASYDRAGRVLAMSDANGLSTTYSYTPRGWLASVNQGGLLTRYDYWPTGLLKQVTQPDGAYLYYQYDDAHRLTDVSDQVDATTGKLAGNTVHYTLDNAGNRLSEDLKDPSGALARNITRSYDALNRLQSVIGAAP